MGLHSTKDSPSPVYVATAGAGEWSMHYQKYDYDVFSPELNTLIIANLFHYVPFGIQKMG